MDRGNNTWNLVLALLSLTAGIIEIASAVQHTEWRWAYGHVAICFLFTGAMYFCEYFKKRGN